MTRLVVFAMLFSGIALLPGARAAEEDAKIIWEKIAPNFKPPEEFTKPDDKLRSPLLFNDGKPVKAKAKVIHKAYPKVSSHTFPGDFDERFPEWVRCILKSQE